MELNFCDDCENLMDLYSDEENKKPKKGKHRMRAHINPLTFTDKYLLWDSPEQVDWNVF